MAEPDIYGLADQFRNALLRQERAAASELVRAYGAAWGRIRERLTALTRDIAEVRAAGGTVPMEWLLSQERYRLLLPQVEAELRVFAQFAEHRIIAEQAEAVSAAQAHAGQLMLRGLGPPPVGITVTFARLPAGAVTDLVGFLADGSPLRAILAELGPAAASAVQTALLAGIATGQGPRDIAQAVQRAFGGNLARALTIARTETLRAYRESSRRVYEANSDVLEGWTWHAKLDTGTCAFCWSMHGSLHEVTERFASHPRCRCASVPLTKTWPALGSPGVRETRIEVPAGAQRFARLSTADQHAVLGPAKFAAYQDGAMSLEDVRGFRLDPRWGPVGYERSLRDILGVREAAAFSVRAMRAA